MSVLGRSHTASAFFFFFLYFFLCKAEKCKMFEGFEVWKTKKAPKKNKFFDHVSASFSFCCRDEGVEITLVIWCHVHTGSIQGFCLNVVIESLLDQISACFWSSLNVKTTKH